MVTGVSACIGYVLWLVWFDQSPCNRRLDAERGELSEHFAESARRLAGPVGLVEDLREAVRSLEEALQSWQSHTQHLEDDLRSRIDDISQSVACRTHYCKMAV
ncbi:unnamed protein product [Symbiodinium pilosum]|uniref:Uncharacterized protein n=1 Tax=Symbiodinium pilosum TaxID=2952 RepID=A0A812KK67_SYMPI|nr:unnamed protein product [Symbiodinium pilosum]